MNKITIKNLYPLPRIEEFLDQLKGEKYFTKTDLMTSYHQLRMASINTWKTTFKTIYWIYEWMVMPFVLTSDPMTFEGLINDIFLPLLGHIMVIYLDEFFVFNKTCEEYLYHVCNILQLLHVNHLQVKEHKSSFGQTFFSYLGFFINHKGVCLDASKV